MKRFWPFLALAAIVFSLIVSQGSNAEGNEEAARTQSTTWGSIKAMYRDDGTAVTLMQKSEGLSFFPSEPAWSNPVASEAIQKFRLNPSDVIAVQRVVMLSNGVPIDSAEVVVTEKQWYYKSLVDESFSQSPPSLPLTTEIDIYGSYVESVSGWHCGNLEWVVTFYLPVCFHEISPGRFDGIIDAWAPNPPCNQCNGGWCIGYLCGSAWDGAGYLGWWDYNTCSPTWSRKVGKLVQKRWLYTWRNCGYPDWQIASWVRARIRY